VEATGFVVVEHVQFGPPAPATDEQLGAAEQLLLGRWRRNPIEMYRTLALQARSQFATTATTRKQCS
jgi:hypothetical protein